MISTPKNLFTFILSIVLVGFIFTLNLSANEPQTIRNLDISRYAGTWYEIARLPNFFEQKCYKNVMAQYTPLASGDIQVINSCLRHNGKKDSIKGLAKVKDRTQNAKLSVSFFSIFGVRPIWGDYWVLDIGTQYHYSVVGDKSRKYAWILSRTPTLNTLDTEKALNALKTNGFDTSRLIYTIQDQNTDTEGLKPKSL